ncbi:hypothetical protein GSI01S_33_00530 [Gordonia sihwensis NBRC 108236]|uniref:Uncharacterized protein n=2 Tax=Gordonia sihwensis TaxID=173559 RepID=L7LQB3_9ACTN|nr:hypothetical protein GSI01S_33_00530 [Gordonia sihwensis NBRC 108236]
MRELGMGESFWNRDQLAVWSRPQWGFLENEPFVALLDAGYGWRVTAVDPPKVRRRGSAPIRVVHMADRFGRALTFDVAMDTNRMSKHATFCRPLDEHVLIADTLSAAAHLGTSDPAGSFTDLENLPGVYRVADFLRHR